jgi:hypothetical protein
MVHSRGATTGVGSAGVQHGPNLLECCHLANGPRVWMASYSAGDGLPPWHASPILSSSSCYSIKDFCIAHAVEYCIAPLSTAM